MAQMTTAQTVAELQRKTSLGIKPTNSANNAAYTALKTPIPSNGINKTPTDGSYGISSVPGTAVGAFAGIPSKGIPAPNVAGSTGSAQDWINNPKSGMGGVDAYTAAQNAKMTAATNSGDTGMLSKLAADSARTGLTYTPTPMSAPKDMPIKPQSTPALVSNWSTTPQQAQQSASEQAAIRIKQLLAGGKNAFDTGSQSAKNAYDYSQQTTQGNRSLLQFDNSQRGDQFGGSAREDKFRLARSQGIEDTASNADYTNKVNSLSQTWQDLQTSAPEQQQAIYDQLYQQAAQLGISADQLNLQAQNQQFNQNIAQSGVTGQYNGQQTQQAQNQTFNQNLQTNQQNQQNQNQQFNQNLQTNEFAYKQARDAIGDQQYKTKFDQDVKQQGFENAVKLAVTNHQMSNDQAQLAISRQNANTNSSQASNSNSNMNQDNLMNVWKATGQAPSGIPNVVAGTPYAGQSAPKPVTVDPKLSAESYTHYKDQIDNSPYTKEQKLAFAKSVESEMTASDYASLIKGIQ